MAQGDMLKRQIEVDVPGAKVKRIKTVKDALAWLELHADTSDSAWRRAAQALETAKADGSLRKIRAATRAFEDTLRRPGRTPGKIDCKRM